MKISMKKYLVAFLFFVVASVQAAQQLPKWFPVEFQEVGIFVSISDDKTTIMLADKQFPLADNVVIGSFSAESHSITVLVENQRVGLVIPDYPNSSTVTQVWIMGNISAN